MEMVETKRQHAWNKSETEWPEEVRFITSMLEGHTPYWEESRDRPRYQYRIKAALELEYPSGITQTVPIYTRDVNATGMGFIVRQGLPAINRARLIRAGTAEDQRGIPCTVQRCRVFIEGWYEGAIRFDVEQPAFEP